MVQQQQQQLQYNETGLGGVSSAEVRIRILVGEKGRLGCGVCRGIIPGLTVQVNSILIGLSHDTWKHLSFLKFFSRCRENYPVSIKIAVIPKKLFNLFQ